MRLPLIAAAAVLALAACKPAGEATPPAETPPAPAPEPIKAELNGVDLTQDLRAVGTEPFWAIDMLKAELKYTTADQPTPVTAPNTGPAMTVGQGVWTATASDGRPLKITVTGMDCSDGMSDRTYPLTAKVEIGDTTLNGCAATIAALDRTRGQESGEVR